jgi:hypothetical protein
MGCEFNFKKVSPFHYQTMRRCDEVCYLMKVVIRFGIQCHEWFNVRNMETRQKATTAEMK